MLRRALVVVPSLVAFGLLVAGVAVHSVVYLGPGVDAPALVAAAVISATITYRLALAAGEPPARWAALASVAGAAWLGVLYLALWLLAVWAFDPD